MTSDAAFVEVARRRFSLDDFRRYAGADAGNHHTSVEQARRIGLPAPLAPGAMIASWIWVALSGRWGARWDRGGRLAVTFLAPAWADDELRLLIDRDAVADRAALRVEDADGRIVLAGTAERFHGTPRGHPR